MEQYLYDCELRLQSSRTLETRRVFFRNLLWFLNHREYHACGLNELRQFFHYLGHGHEEPAGRFGNPNLKRAVRPITVRDYYICFRSFYAWLVAQQELHVSPFDSMAKPQVREETKAPLSTEQINSLFAAAVISEHPLRNKAILSLLLDTGCRASELIAMRRKDVDLENRRCQVLGKGDKHRTLFFGQKTAEAIGEYLTSREVERPAAFSAITSEADRQRPLFHSRVRHAKRLGLCPTTTSHPVAPLVAPLTRSGLLQLLKRLGTSVGIRDEVCVHSLRRSFAVQMLKNGAHVFSVQAILGHTDLQQTRHYCMLALTDAEDQHRHFGPMDRLEQPGAKAPHSLG